MRYNRCVVNDYTKNSASHEDSEGESMNMAQISRSNFKSKDPFPRVFEFIATLSRSRDVNDVRVDRGAFTRGGTLSPDLMITLLLYMAGDGNRSGYGHLLTRFWDQADDFGIELPSPDPVSAASFCAARDKLSAEFLRSLVLEVHEKIGIDFPETAVFRGRRVFAVDGCKVNLRRSGDLDREFGRPSGGHVPQSLMSVLVNVCNRAPADVVARPTASCERSILLDEHLQFLRRGDLLVLDRGYPSYEVVRHLLDAGIDFLIRLPASSTFPGIEEFVDSDLKESAFTLKLPSTREEEGRQVRLRAVRLETANGPTVSECARRSSLRSCFSGSLAI